MDRLSVSLFDAAVDLNPHQIEAALFALQSPLSKGVILADEVGLGKTIEAGIVLCQFWAERKRRLLIICPASLRKQWALELGEKFNLPVVVLDAKVYREERELTIMLLVDVSSSCFFGTQRQLKQELAAEIASVLAFAATKSNDKVGLIIFSDHIEKFIPPKKGSRHTLRLIRELLAFEPAGRGTDIRAATDEFRDTVAHLVARPAQPRR
jgi:uncharacterized protein with von Willebrand factor type A (vWA) domain